jgi:hypothetical protein
VVWGADCNIYIYICGDSSQQVIGCVLLFCKLNGVLTVNYIYGNSSQQVVSSDLLYCK